jgi:8-oxo-dGTP pyrophosphatase MutT (NUDIX family)
LLNESPAPTVPRPAATVMLLRAAGAGFAVYLARRSAKSSFMPGAYVFPGGAVDAADRDEAAFERVFGSVRGIGLEYVIAALRELFEEAGVLIACRADGGRVSIPDDTLRDLRRAIAQGKHFISLLSEDDLYLDARKLLYYSNWITPALEPRRFDTHFFVAHPPEGQIAEADAVELHDGVWLTPHEALEQAARGELNIVFPTRKHLERMAEFATLDAFLEHAAERAVRPCEPFVRADGTLDFSPGESAW